MIRKIKRAGRYRDKAFEENRLTASYHSRADGAGEGYYEKG
jgi:hypothetical protein